MQRFLVTLLAAVLMPLMAFAQTATMYRSPSCGCCLGHAEYLRQQGYEVEVVSLDPQLLALFKEDSAIPARQQGCHTLVIDGYLIEGHVPVEAIEKLLAERPEIAGITLPGMPAGSPGMGGEKAEPFKVLVIGEDDEVFAII